MKRNQMREQAFLLTFESLFDNEKNIQEIIDVYNENIEPVCEYAQEVFTGVNSNRDKLDEIISAYSKSWKLSRLPKVTVAVLYVALYEMKFVDSVPDSIAINEAVELAKKYAGVKDASFINGILGAVSRGE